MKKSQDEAVHASSFIKSITCLTGIPEIKLKKYAAENNLFNVLEHPNTIDPNKQQLEKIHILNEFIATYRLLKLQENENRLVFNSPKIAGEYFASLLGGTKDREKFMAAFLDNGNHIIETRTFSEGTIGEAPIYPREILKAALGCDCKGMILAHNHPGGSLDFSLQDREITQKLISIFSPLHISVLDHIVVANSGYSSMAEKIGMPQPSENISYEAVPVQKSRKVKEDKSVYDADLSEFDGLDLDSFDFPEQDDPEDEWER